MTNDAHTILASRIEYMEAKYGVNGVALREILGEFLQAVHETTYKGNSTEALMGIHFGVGEEAAYHFGGLIYSSYDHSEEYVSDLRGMWHETLLRMGTHFSRFGTTVERWKVEVEHDAEDED